MLRKIDRDSLPNDKLHELLTKHQDSRLDKARRCVRFATSDNMKPQDERRAELDAVRRILELYGMKFNKLEDML